MDGGVSSFGILCKKNGVSHCHIDCKCLAKVIEMVFIDINERILKESSLGINHAKKMIMVMII